MYLAQAAFHEDHERQRCKQHNDHTQNNRCGKRAGAARFEKLSQCSGQFSNNTHKDDQRNTVADAALGDLFTKPHQEHGTPNKGNHAGGPEEPARIGHKPTRFKADRKPVGLESC